MAKKHKAFDCVEMKRKAQEEILAEWEARKHEFPSYGEFLEAGIKQSEWGRRVWEEIRHEARRSRENQH